MIKEVDYKSINDFEIKNRQSPFTKFFGFYEDNALVALLEFDHIYERLEIVNIYVKEEVRGKGIGSKLMEKLISYGKENKCSNITLEVKRCNLGAIGLYKKYGFSEVAIRKGYYDGVDGLLMELIL